MAILKYTVSNKEGKKLSGTVEAPDENIARTELNNLGFTILQLQETTELPKIDTSLTKYVFEAIDKNSKLVSGSIPAKSPDEAAQKLTSEYALNVSAIWQEGATPEQIAIARKEGQTKFQNQLASPVQTAATTEKTPEDNLAEEKRIQFIKTKIETILKAVNELLKNFDKDLAPDQKMEINKKIDKLLRIKNSTNVDYILESANELLKFLEDQEKILKESSLKEKRFEFQVSTQKLLHELNKDEHKKSFSEDLLEKINNWQQTHITNQENASTGARIINGILNPIKEFFTTPPEILAIKEQISIYNKQIWEFIKLYFKEPTPEYKEKVKNSIITVWEARKRAKENLKKVKEEIKTRKRANQIDENLMSSFVQEINALTGWLLTFYVIYYLSSLYVNTKNFGLAEIPNGLHVYESHLFKYILVTIFLLHSSTALKLNFFRDSIIANFILPPMFLFGTIVALLNY